MGFSITANWLKQLAAMPKFVILRKLGPLLIMVFLPWLLLQLLSNPSCTGPLLNEHQKDNLQLAAMVVADLHLAGPMAAWADRVRRDSFMKSSLKSAYRMLKPHALLVLGDISDWGRKSTKQQWESVVQRFHDMLQPFLGLPIHVTVGNHDVGDFYQLTPTLLRQFVNSFPGLDDTGSDVFAIRNISFVSLNAMALACDDCPLHSSMQRVVGNAKATLEKGFSSTVSSKSAGQMDSTSFDRNALQKPVLLLHLPLHRVDESVCHSIDIPRCSPWHEVEGGCLQLGVSAKSSQVRALTPYRSMMDMLSVNTSRYLLSALNPRLVLSAHAHHFCDRVHDDGTREITVSTFSWRNRDDPSFLYIHFYKDGATDIQQCFLPRESLVLALHVLQGVAIVAVIAICCTRYWILQRRVHLKA